MKAKYPIGTNRKVCLEPFSETDRVPKLLPCGHTFCERCIISLTSTYIYTCRCPKCRAAFVLRYDTRFPTNYSLMDVLSHLKQPMPVAEEGEARMSEEGLSLTGQQQSVPASGIPSSSHGVRNTSRVSQLFSRLSGKHKRHGVDTGGRGTTKLEPDTEAVPFTSTPDLPTDEDVFTYEQPPFTDSESEEEDTHSESEQQLSPYDSVDVASLSVEAISTEIERLPSHAEQLQMVRSSAREMPSDAVNNISRPNDSVQTAESQHSDGERRVSASGVVAKENAKNNAIRRSVVILLEVAIFVITAFWLATFLRLVYTEYSRPPEQPTIFCATLEVIDSWLSTQLSSSMKCTPAQPESIFERFNTEAEHLGADVYDAISYAGSSTSQFVASRTSNMKVHLVPFVNMLFQNAYALVDCIRDCFSSVVEGTTSGIRTAFWSRRSNDHIEDL
ncbi:E3 ubiquitin-protein ligase SH3RF1 [Toxocara canis]|uniref:E3 ubiquitin-protein ligase SH3RF1 n=1 Tax=Toxocara canis TaxID=6265 RepID=A0A0B2V3L1_TOXCA|nr:E3 ubiquitin-protein ligase SH3RF1 [Toxocara canis]